jgi:hypothetical protein
MSAKVTTCTIFERIAASGPEGIARPDLMEGLAEWEMKRALRRAILAGRPLIFRRYHADGVAVMFFKCEEDRAAFDAKNTAAKRQRKAAREAARGEDRIAWYHANRARILETKRLWRAERAEKRAALPPKPKKPPKYVPKPITFKRESPKRSTPSAVFANAEPDYSLAVVTVAPTPKERFAVELAKGHVSALNPQECRPWAQAATMGAA